MKRIFLSVLLVLLTVSVSACGAAKCDVDKYNTTVQPLAKQWDDAVALANQTPRASLAPQISALQSIERETEALTVDECLKDTHAELVSSMTSTIDGFLAFLGQEPDAKITALFQSADTHLNQWKSKLAAVGK